VYFPQAQQGHAQVFGTGITDLYIGCFAQAMLQAFGNQAHAVFNLSRKLFTKRCAMSKTQLLLDPDIGHTLKFLSLINHAVSNLRCGHLLLLPSLRFSLQVALRTLSG